MDATFADAPSTDAAPRKSRVTDGVEAWLEHQLDLLPLWLPVAFGTGAAMWFALPTRDGWLGWLIAMAAVVAAGLALPLGGRGRRALVIAGVVGALGLGGAWIRASLVASPVLARPVIATFTGRVEAVEVQAAKDRYRVTLVPRDAPALTPRVRVTIATADAPQKLAEGDILSLRARLVGPPTASIPGGYDFARTAWFMQLGATGKAMGKVERLSVAPDQSAFRARLTAHIREQITGSAGGIAAAFATGDRGGISTEDEDAMRNSGLTHLLSVSGLHITAVVGAAMFLTLRVLALSPFLALRFPLVAISAGVGAMAGIGYTLLTGAEVPTIRSCVAAVLIVIGIILGRQAFTLRLVATGALVVLIFWPEAVVGPSFQLSFAAITSIVALHEWGLMHRFLGPRDEGMVMKLGRGLVSLLATGLVVEAALAPIALYHFHKQGLYGALANIVAIPLTTFVTMPLEALALLFDAVGLGAPFWWATGLSLDLLLWIARVVAGWPGAVAALPSVPVVAFALMIYGGLWLMLWRGRVRAAGVVSFVIGAVWTLATPSPDLLVTGDGMHLAVRGDDGRLATLRPRAGDYVRSVMSERFGDLGELDDLDALHGAVCSADVCRVDLVRGGRTWRVVATRSHYLLPPQNLREECAAADIVVSDRRLPPWCNPRWVKADRPFLARTGGMAISLAGPSIETVTEGEGEHPWVSARKAAEKVGSGASASRRAER